MILDFQSMISKGYFVLLAAALHDRVTVNVIVSGRFPPTARNINRRRSNQCSANDSSDDGSAYKRRNPISPTAAVVVVVVVLLVALGMSCEG